MVRSTTLALLLLTACAPIRYEKGSPVEEVEPTSIVGLEIPDTPDMREPYTSYHRITRAGGSDVVGYAVRYDPLPPHKANLERDYPTGTVFIEDRTFHRVGFLTALGRGYRFAGGKTEEVGQGTIEYLLPHFFGGEAFQVVPVE